MREEKRFMKFIQNDRNREVISLVLDFCRTITVYSLREGAKNLRENNK